MGFDSRRDASDYSICRLIRAQAEQNWTGAGLERDLSNLATTKSGMAPNGAYIPLGIALRDFNGGTAGEAGNLIGATIDGARAVDPLRKASVLAGLGATILPGLRSTLQIPRFTSSDSAAWKSEVAAAGAILRPPPRVELTPKRSAVVMVMSRQALIQATPELDQAVSRHSDRRAARIVGIRRDQRRRHRAIRRSAYVIPPASPTWLAAPMASQPELRSHGRA